MFSRNKGGSYTRARAIPVNRNTPAQTAIRNALKVASSAYATSTTPSQQAGWTTFAQTNPVVNKIGVSKNLSGIGMFQKVNVGLVNLLGPSAIQLDSPGAVTFLGSLVAGAALALTAGVFHVDVIGPGAFAIGDILAFFVTTPCPPSRTPVHQPQVLLGFSTLAAVPTIPNEYTHTYPDPGAATRAVGSAWMIRAYWYRGANLSPDALFQGVT